MKTMSIMLREAFMIARARMLQAVQGVKLYSRSALPGWQKPVSHRSISFGIFSSDICLTI